MDINHYRMRTDRYVTLITRKAWRKRRLNVAQDGVTFWDGVTWTDDQSWAIDPKPYGHHLWRLNGRNARMDCLILRKRRYNDNQLPAGWSP